MKIMFKPSPQYTARWLEVGYNEGEFIATVSEGPEAHIVLDVIRLSNFRADMEKRTDEGFICELCALKYILLLFRFLRDNLLARM